MPARACTVSFTGPDGIRHSVNIQAETLYEAVVLAIRAFREHDCAPGPAAHLDIEVKSPSVRHTVVARKIEEWLTGGAKSPSEAVEKRRLKEIARRLTNWLRIGDARWFAPRVER